MTGEEILRALNRLLDLHLEIRCSIHQAGYKDDYFNLFLEAYRNGHFEPSASPRLTGAAISDRFFAAGWMGDTRPSAPKSRVLRDLLRMWDEWYYALSKIHAEP